MKVLIVGEGKHEENGALETLVRRLCPYRIDTCRFERAGKIRASHGIGPRFFKKAIACIKRAHRDGFDALVFLIDEDGDHDRVQQLNQAQDHNSDGIPALPRALGVAIRTFDAWMLADEHALTAVLSIEVKKQRSPESHKNAKTICKQFLQSCSLSMSQSEMYAAVLQTADVEILVKRCPKGFAPFAERVRALTVSNRDSNR